MKASTTTNKNQMYHIRCIQKSINEETGSVSCNADHTAEVGVEQGTQQITWQNSNASLAREHADINSGTWPLNSGLTLIR